MLKKTFAICIIVLLLCICLGACSDNKLSYSVGTLSSYNKYNGDLPKPAQWNTKQVIKTKEELNSFNSEFDISSYITEYDEAYFTHKALIICLFTYSYLGANLTIKSIQKSENTIQINMIEKIKRDTNYLDAIDYWVCIIEEELENVQDVNDIEINLEKKMVY